jgi:hypothetical protein
VNVKDSPTAPFLREELKLTKQSSKKK